MAEIDDFTREGAAVVRNADLIRLLDERSQEKTTFTLSQVREQLQAKPKRPKKEQKTKKA